MRLYEFVFFEVGINIIQRFRSDVKRLGVTGLLKSEVLINILSVLQEKLQETHNDLDLASNTFQLLTI